MTATTFPAPSTDLDGLHDLLASTQAATQRWLDKAATKDEPPSATEINNITLAARRVALMHRDIYRLENPSVIVPSSQKSPPTSKTNLHTSSSTSSSSAGSAPLRENSSDPVDPANSETPSAIPTYPREIARYVAASIIATIGPNPDEITPICPDLHDELARMKSNPDYLDQTLDELSAESDSPTPTPSPLPLTMPIQSTSLSFQHPP